MNRPLYFETQDEKNDVLQRLDTITHSLIGHNNLNALAHYAANTLEGALFRIWLCVGETPVDKWPRTK